MTSADRHQDGPHAPRAAGPSPTPTQPQHMLSPSESVADSQAPALAGPADVDEDATSSWREMPRTMGLDVGSVRIGVALSCPFGRMASPLCVLLRAKNPFAEIKKLCAEREVARIVVGRPLRLNGEDGPAVAQIEGFVRRLQQDVPLEVAWVDERLTTKAAERSMLAHGASRKTRRQHIDEVAAALLLQTYLDGARLKVR